MNLQTTSMFSFILIENEFSFNECFLLLSRIPWPSSHLAQSCENELQELMLQIDKMIKDKTSEWDRSQEVWLKVLLFIHKLPTS